MVGEMPRAIYFKQYMNGQEYISFHISRKLRFFKGAKGTYPSWKDYSNNIGWCSPMGTWYLQGTYEDVPILYLSLTSMKNSQGYKNEVEM